jgi:hypothetical protein
MYFLIVLGVLFVVVLVVSAPLRNQRARRPIDSTELADLDAARDAKYREIRDAELDRRTGKLSEDDYQAIDQTLRGEAIEILHALDRARGQTPATIEPQ